MESRYLLSDIIEMLKIINDDDEKMAVVNTFMENITEVDEEDAEYEEYDSVIPKHTMDMLVSIKYDNKKLLKLLNFIEEELIQNTEEDKDECEAIDDFKTIIPQIADALETGYIVYLNPETLEMELVEAKTVSYVMDEFQEQNDDLMDEYQLDYVNWDNYIKFEPFNYQDTTTFMEDFIRQLSDVQLANRLEDTLTIEESYDRFCDIVKGSTGTSQQWDEFKRKSMEEYIRNQLIGKIKNIEVEEPASDIPGRIY